MSATPGKIIKIALPILLVMVIVLVLAAPIGPMPGVIIGGKETQVPEAWPDTSQIDEIRLEVPGVIPRVVIIWVIEHQSELYVVGSRSSGWVRKLDQGGPVRVRILDNTYAVEAAIITEGQRPVLEDYMNKYRADYPEIVNGFPSIEEGIDSFSLFRLERPDTD